MLNLELNKTLPVSRLTEQRFVNNLLYSDAVLFYKLKTDKESSMFSIMSTCKSIL